VGRYSSVGIATHYGLEGSGIISRLGARFSAPVQTSPRAHPASYAMGTGSFPRVKRAERGVDRPPHLAPKLKKEQAIPPLRLWASLTFSTVKFTFLPVCREKWPFYLWLTGWIRIKIRNPDSVVSIVARLRVRVLRISKLSIPALGPTQTYIKWLPWFPHRG
jgi:hypothetical protein